MTKITVRGYHLDGYQHVNNARYLEFLEEARWQYLENFDKEAYAKMEITFIIVNININYRLPATAGDVLNIKTEIAKIGTTSMTFSQKITLEGTEKVVCDASVTFVILDQKTGKPCRISGELKSLLVKE